MPWNGLGTYNLPPAYSPEVNGTVIDAVRYNGLTTDVASGLTNALTKDGQNVPTGNLPMGGFKHTGAAAGASVGEYLTVGQAAAPFALGALATPSITFIGDLNTGMWSPGADTIAFSAGGVETFRMAATANLFSKAVTINTAAVGGFLLTVTAAGAAANNTLQIVNTDNTNVASHARFAVSSGGAAAGDAYLLFDIAAVQDWAIGVDNSDSDRFKISAASTLGTSDVLIININGTVGIGGASTGAPFEVTSSGDPYLSVRSSGANPVQVYFQASSAGSTAVLGTLNNYPLQFYTNSTQRVQIATTGDFAVQSAIAGGSLANSVTNASAAANSNARFLSSVNGAAAGDPYTLFDISGVQDWACGVDNSDSDKFKISSSGALGTNDCLTITVGGVIADGAGNELGLRKLISASITSGTPTAVESGKVIYMSAAVTLPSAVFTVGDTLILQNNTGGALAVTQGAGLTLTWTSTAGGGSRSIKPLGRATVLYASGAGAFITGDLT